RMTVKLINMIAVLLGVFLLLSIWGVKQNELFLFISSVMTVLGIAFFAQWSLLSNISAGLILFFNHPLRLGHTIQVLDKEYPVKGVVQDIGYYFVHIETEDGQKLTIPNSLLLQKIIAFE
ncbi:MAG: mechanosensitive ion channel domain-containing protein, partial [Salibacteraceae bacterium]